MAIVIYVYFLACYSLEFIGWLMLVMVVVFAWYEQS